MRFTEVKIKEEAVSKAKNVIAPKGAPCGALPAGLE
jgi:hypothetical protein